MKSKELRKWLAIGTAVVIALSVTGCARETGEVQEPEEAVVTEGETEAEIEAEEAYEEEEEEEAEAVEAEIEVEAETEEAEEEQGEITYQEVMDNYDQVVDLYNMVYDLYTSEDVPQDDGVEKIFSDIEDALDEIVALKEEDIPTDEDKMAVIATMGDIGGILNELIEPMVDAANENMSQQDYYNHMVELVQQNYDYMNAYFNAVWDHLAQYGGTESQIDEVILARDAIGDINTLSTATAEELVTMNDCINSVIDLLDRICGH